MFNSISILRFSTFPFLQVPYLPQRLHRTCVLLWRLPKLEVPFAVHDISIFCPPKYLRYPIRTHCGCFDGFPVRWLSMSSCSLRLVKFNLRRCRKDASEVGALSDCQDFEPQDLKSQAGCGRLTPSQLLHIRLLTSAKRARPAPLSDLYEELMMFLFKLH